MRLTPLSSHTLQSSGTWPADLEASQKMQALSVLVLLFLASAVQMGVRRSPGLHREELPMPLVSLMTGLNNNPPNLQELVTQECGLLVNLLT